MMDSLLDALKGAHPLPADWSKLTLVEDTIAADGLTLHRAGIASVGPGGEELVGSAADPEASPLDRAYFELVERVATVEAIRAPPRSIELFRLDGRSAAQRPSAEVFPVSDAPDRWRYARSNGVAVHVDRESASLRAYWELCERDRVLRTWFGESTPRRQPDALDSSSLARAASYEWLAYDFPETEASAFSRGVHVRGVFGFPKKEAPFVFGYGARPSAADALRAAEREATQLLAFLWGEELTQTIPPFAPTPMYHLETYQRVESHRALRSWLEGAHAAYRGATPIGTGDPEVLFADLTPSWLRGLSVSKAVCAGAVPLTFGDGPLGARLPRELRVHPIA